MRPTLDSYRHLASGKVRELYEIDDETLLMVSTDRISAFDHVLATPIRDKGRILTAMSFHWFDVLGVPNHLVGGVDDPRVPADVVGRSMVVRRLPMVSVECVARGYLTGSGLADYRATGEVCGITLPTGLGEASRLPEPLFTPTTKAPVGEHDEHITYDDVVASEGAERAAALRDTTLGIYRAAADLARSRGIILADTKFEFGADPNGGLVLADEVLTPDSSRYWDADAYTPGVVQPSFDKQIVREWLTGAESGWDRASGDAPPALPESVAERARLRYIEAYERISGRVFADWPGAQS